MGKAGAEHLGERNWVKAGEQREKGREEKAVEMGGGGIKGCFTPDQSHSFWAPSSVDE